MSKYDPRLEKIADDIWRGKYGKDFNGKKRREVLGEDYAGVQAIINDKHYGNKPKSKSSSSNTSTNTNTSTTNNNKDNNSSNSRKIPDINLDINWDDLKFTTNKDNKPSQSTQQKSQSIKRTISSEDKKNNITQQQSKQNKSNPKDPNARKRPEDYTGIDLDLSLNTPNPKDPNARKRPEGYTDINTNLSLNNNKKFSTNNNYDISEFKKSNQDKAQRTYNNIDLSLGMWSTSNQKTITKPTEYELEKRKDALLNNSPVHRIVNELSTIGENGINRIIQKSEDGKEDEFYSSSNHTKEADSSKNTLKWSQQKNKDTKQEEPNNQNYKIIKESYYGDKIDDKKNKNSYISYQDINLDDYTFKHRNRGDNSPVEKTKGLLISAFNKFEPKRNYKNVSKDEYGNQAYYIGYGQNGRIKVGKDTDFDDDDVIARSGKITVTGFKRDENNKISTTSGKAHGNPNNKVPIIYDSDGKERTLPFLIKNGSDKYGSISGGGIIVVCGNEKRQIRGSVDQVEAAINDMKKRHNSKTVDLYYEDNGTYNTGYTTKNERISSNEWRNYDLRNTSGGHGLYEYQTDSKEDSAFRKAASYIRENNIMPNDLMNDRNIAFIADTEGINKQQLINDLKNRIYYK